MVIVMILGFTYGIAQPPLIRAGMRWDAFAKLSVSDNICKMSWKGVVGKVLKCDENVKASLYGPNKRQKHQIPTVGSRCCTGSEKLTVVFPNTLKPTLVMLVFIVHPNRKTLQSL